MRKSISFLLLLAFSGCLTKQEEKTLRVMSQYIDMTDTLQGVDDFSIQPNGYSILTERKYIHYYPDTVMVNTNLYDDDTIKSIVREAQNGIPDATSDPKGDFVMKVKGMEYRYKYDYDVPFMRRVTDYIDTKTAGKYQAHPKD